MNLLESITRFYASSVGKKILVALSGLVLLLFLAGHLAGNLLIYLGRTALNDYAEFLHHALHGTGVWFARAGLLAAIVVHVTATIQLARQNRAARQASRYVFETTVQASNASRTMITTGIIILSFIIFHLLHFTILPGPEDPGYHETATRGHMRPDVYNMVVRGFQNILIATFYIVSMAFLCFHLSHGFASVFQTLGWRTEKSAQLIDSLGKAYAAFIFFGNISIPLAVQFGFVGLQYG